MVLKNSGKIFRFELEHNQGFAYCEFVDFSDLFSFDGRLIYVFDLIEKQINKLANISYIETHKILFGPVPLIKAPNIRNKEVKLNLIGKTNNIKSEMPVFKYIILPTIKKDWTKLEGWQKNTWGIDRGKPGSSGLSKIVNYEEVRYLEEAVLHTMKGIVIRTTMLVLIRENKKIKDFYDLQDFYLRGLYIRVVNTSLSKIEGEQLLNEIQDIPTG